MSSIDDNRAVSPSLSHGRTQESHYSSRVKMSTLSHADGRTVEGGETAARAFPDIPERVYTSAIE